MLVSVNTAIEIFYYKTCAKHNFFVSEVN